MSQASALKSLQITGLDGTPAVSYTTGEGAPGNMRTVDGYVTALSADTTSSVYKFVRLPSSAKIKSVHYASMVASAGAADLNIAYSDSTVDGTSAANQGTIPQISSANNKLFGAANTLVGTGQKVDATFLNTTNFPLTATALPLWAALGLASDPGGMFDVQMNVTTAITTGGLIYVSVDYVD